MGATTSRFFRTRPPSARGLAKVRRLPACAFVIVCGEGGRITTSLLVAGLFRMEKRSLLLRLASLRRRFRKPNPFDSDSRSPTNQNMIAPSLQSGSYSYAVRIPGDRILIPGVIDSTTNFVEHPRLVAQRICRYTNIVGRERIVASADCRFG